MRMRTKPSFLFGGVSSRDFNVDVLDIHEERCTVRDHRMTPISGRTGDLVQDFGRYENITLVVTCAVTKHGEGYFRALHAELLSMTGYHRLEHSYDSDHYRMAVFKGEVKPKISRSDDKAVFDLEFNCKPQRYLRAGDHVETFTPDTVVDSGFYTYDDFSDYAQERLSLHLSDIGYSQEDIEEMEYLIAPVDIPLSPSYSMIEIQTESALPFFALRFTVDPLEDVSNLDFLYKDKTFRAYRSAVQQEGQYLILQRNSPLKILQDSDVVFNYDIFDDYQIKNPTPFAASPLLRMELKSGAFDDYLVSINGCNVRLNRDMSTDMGSVNALTVDCVDMNAYSLPEDNADGRVINCNPFVTYTNYDIVLTRGENDVLVSGNVDKLELMPRWWTL